MTGKEIKNTIEYWLETAKHDYQTMEYLFKGKKYSESLFFGHIVLEKILKALVVNETRKQAPYTHNLVELEKISKTCQVGIATYDMDKKSATYYTDPGKIKTYASLSLPIIMSNVSSVASYVRQFGCGKIINKNNEELAGALVEIENNYDTYLKGLDRFNKFFFYDTYYKKSFKFLEYE